MAFPRRDTVLVALTYGPTADWVRNVLAGGAAELEERSGTRTIRSAVLVARTDVVDALPVMIRAATRLIGVDQFLELELS